MGVKVREKPKGSGVYWIFINQNKKRTSRRIGSKAARREGPKDHRSKAHSRRSAAAERQAASADAVVLLRGTEGNRFSNGAA